LGDYQVLTAACDATSVNFLGGAPSSLSVSGCVCHPEANGVYFLQRDTPPLGF
jgi:hypothetical protein